MTAQQKTRRWDVIGLGAGAALGVIDLFVFFALDARMDLSGRDSTALYVLGAFVLSYAALGFAVGRLAIARARARADERTIRRQLTELEDAQRSLVEQEKLAAIGRLAAGIAHEVRNPLGVIRASASMVRDSVADRPDEARACEFICDETDRLNRLITGLLSFARPAQPQLRDTRIDEVLDHALELAAEELSRRDIRASKSVAAALPAVRADPDLLSQAILGIATNAAEAMENGGHLTVRASAADTAVRLEITDDGPGVDDGAAAHIFEPFFTTKASGTGLGLPMASRIVQAHGGRLELISHAPAGACFRITLPFAQAGRAA